MLMLLAGYETTGNSMIFLAYNLAAYPEVQEKLRQEIDETVEKDVRTYFIFYFFVLFYFLFIRIAQRQRYVVIQRIDNE